MHLESLLIATDCWYIKFVCRITRLNDAYKITLLFKKITQKNGKQREITGRNIVIAVGGKKSLKFVKPLAL